ncbi:MAG: glycosyltransferase family 2 protein [Planctomycetia bacterium]|nr:glycosyltransferase family 2 protein [Planctomycetia bacterium]
MGANPAGVTIAIPNWNHELVLPRAIISALASAKILRERGTPCEILVIDDGSRDGSLTLLRQLEAIHYADGMRLLAFSDSRSLAEARNQALLNAQYRYVAFLDADNELVPENLPTLVRTLDDTSAAVAYGNLLYRTAASQCAFGVLSNEPVQGAIFEHNYIDSFSLVDRDQLLDVGGYNTTFNVMEDYEQWHHLVTNGRLIVFVPVVFGYYYVLPQSMSNNLDRYHEFAPRFGRMYDQFKVRSRLAFNTKHLRYFPDIGYI